jgi:hypothetical protein
VQDLTSYEYKLYLKNKPKILNEEDYLFDRMRVKWYKSLKKNREILFKYLDSCKLIPDSSIIYLIEINRNEDDSQFGYVIIDSISKSYEYEIKRFRLNFSIKKIDKIQNTDVLDFVNGKWSKLTEFIRCSEVYHYGTVIYKGKETNFKRLNW